MPDMRLDGGAIVDEIVLEGIGRLTARYERDVDGWTASFNLAADGVDDLTVCHRLSAPSLADARRAVPLAAAFLAGEPVDGPLNAARDDLDDPIDEPSRLR
jgi:hypothetical protein